MLQSRLSLCLGKDTVRGFWLQQLTVLRGANTDLLGRRWFLVLGNLFSFVGHIILGTAKTGTAAIAGMTVIGAGAGLCQMATFALPVSQVIRRQFLWSSSAALRFCDSDMLLPRNCYPTSGELLVSL